MSESIPISITVLNGPKTVKECVKKIEKFESNFIKLQKILQRSTLCSFRRKVAVGKLRRFFNLLQWCVSAIFPLRRKIFL